MPQQLPFYLKSLIKMSETMKTTFGNPSSLHAHGRMASKLLRESPRANCSVSPYYSKSYFLHFRWIRSNNTVIKGLLLETPSRWQTHHYYRFGTPCGSRTHRISCRTFRIEVTIVQPREGRIQASDIKAALRPDTILVSTMFANNETGDLLPN